MAWILLVVAGVFEVGWAIGLKYTDGFSRPLPTLLTVASMVVSLGLLGLALRDLPVGTAAFGVLLFGDPATVGRLACIGLIVAGIAGLKLVS